MSAPQQKPVVRAVKTVSAHAKATPTTSVVKKAVSGSTVSKPKPAISKVVVKSKPSAPKKPTSAITTPKPASSAAAKEEGDRCDIEEDPSTDGDDQGSDLEDFIASESSDDAEEDLTLEQYKKHMAEIKSMYRPKLSRDMLK
jgi:hypothetical protein